MHFKQPRRIINQMALYALVALIGLVADFATVFILKEYCNLYYLIAVCIGFLIGLVITFLLSNWAVFGQPKTDIRLSFILFGIIGAVGLAILSGLVWFFTSVLGIYYITSKVIATIFVFFWNFFARKALYKDPS